MGDFTSGQLDSILRREKELDVAMALHNLNLHDRLKLMGTIPKRAKSAAGSQILAWEIPPKMAIPKAVKVTDANFPLHVKEFIDGLTFMGPTLHKIAVAIKPFDIFSDRNLKYGENLFLGGNVVQIAVQEEHLGIWRVRFNVGASKKFTTYKCYARLNKDAGVLASVCECKAGLVFLNPFFIKIDRFLVLIIVDRKGKCSHLGAGIHALDLLNRKRDDVHLVRIVTCYCFHVIVDTYWTL